MDAVNIALQSAFILIFVVVLVHYLRDPRPVHRDLVLVFASVVALFAIAIVTSLIPGIPRAVNQMSGGGPAPPAVSDAAPGGPFRPRVAVAVDRVS